MRHLYRRHLAVGMTVGLLLLGRMAQPAAAGVAHAAAVGTGTYLVQPNDTLSGIALRFRTTPEALVAANGLRDDRDIVPGQVLRIPGRADRGVEGRGWGHGQHNIHDVPRRDRASGRAAPVNTAQTHSTVRAGQPIVAPVTTATPLQPATVIPVPSTPVTAAQMTPTAATGVDAPGSVAALLTTQAQAAGVDPALVKAVAWQESGWRMVTAADGGIGIMQLMPDTVTWVETTLLGQRIAPYTPVDNVRAGSPCLPTTSRCSGASGSRSPPTTRASRGCGRRGSAPRPRATWPTCSPYRRNSRSKPAHKGSKGLSPPGHHQPRVERPPPYKRGGAALV